MTRHGFVAACTGVVVALWVKPTRAARQWTLTNRRPFRGHRELNQRFGFDGDTFESRADELHKALDHMVAAMRYEIDKQPANLWRVGEIRLRVRVGYAETPEEWAIARGEMPYPHTVVSSTLVKTPTHCEECGSPIWKLEVRPC